jgi:hypothetical protein
VSAEYVCIIFGSLESVYACKLQCCPISFACQWAVIVRSSVLIRINYEILSTHSWFLENFMQGRRWPTTELAKVTWTSLIVAVLAGEYCNTTRSQSRIRAGRPHCRTIIDYSNTVSPFSRAVSTRAMENPIYNCSFDNNSPLPVIYWRKYSDSVPEPNINKYRVP